MLILFMFAFDDEWVRLSGGIVMFIFPVLALRLKLSLWLILLCKLFLETLKLIFLGGREETVLIGKLFILLGI